MLEPRNLKALSISVVAPVYNEQGNIKTFYERASKVLSELGMQYELIFVNDGSRDDSLLLLSRLAQSDTHVRIISFSKNFGHQVAVSAGLDHANGDAVVIIDTDLQDPPEVIAELVAKWQEGYEVIDAKRRSRQDSFMKVLTAKIFYKLLNILVTNDIPEDVGDFRLLDHNAVMALRQIKEKDRYLRGLTNWIGFKHATVLFDRDKRFSGKTHYPIKKMLKLAFTAIFSFSSFPLKVANIMAAIFFCFAVVLIGYILVIESQGYAIPGWTSQVLISSVFACGQMLVLGILSEYIGRIYIQVQDRPMYIISDLINFPKSAKK